jgi:AcrR family transcriptional regulator
MGRTNGWAGAPPATDEQARVRILDATRACIDRRGDRTTMTNVADELSVTRETIYRYFPSTEDLLLAASLDASSAFLDRLSRHTRRIADPIDAIIEGIVYVADNLPNEPYLGPFFSPDRVGRFAANISSEANMTLGRAFLQPFADQWAGVSARTVDELTEWGLRILQSILLDPGRPPRHGRVLRTYLSTWLAPALRQALQTAASQPEE